LRRLFIKDGSTLFIVITTKCNDLTVQRMSICFGNILHYIATVKNCNVAHYKMIPVMNHYWRVWHHLGKTVNKLTLSKLTDKIFNALLLNCRSNTKTTNLHCEKTKYICVLQPFYIFTACFPAAPKIINWVYCIFIVFGLLMKVQVFLLWHGMQNRLKQLVYHIWLEWEREKQWIEFFSQ
jgi:hypothetical protein